MDVYVQTGGVIENSGTINNSGLIGIDGSVDNYGTIGNVGVIDNAGNIYTFSGSYINNGGFIDNAGTITNYSGGTISNYSGGTITNSSTIYNLGGTITNSGTLNNFSGGTISNNSGGTINNNSGGTINTDGTLSNDGTITNNSGGTITNSGTIGNTYGTINNSTGGTIYNTGTIGNTYGIINNNSGGTINNNSGGTITNYSGGTIKNNSGGIINNNSGGTINTDGTINNYSGGTINNNSGGTINNNSGGTINNSGTLTNQCGAVYTGTLPTGNPINYISCLPTISINDITLTEGNSGTKNFAFTVTRTGDTTGVSSVQFATADGTATISNSDYIANSGTLTFTAGQTTKTVTVRVNGDISIEPDENFYVNLSSCTGCTISDTQGLGTILNDDSPPRITLAPSTGPVGTKVTVTGTGYAVNSAITIKYGGVVQTIPATTTNATGSFSVTFTVPVSIFGLHPVAASDASAHTATVNFNVTPKVTLLPGTGPVGTKVKVTGTGYGSNSAITIKYGGVVQTIPATTTNATGYFSTSPPGFTVPASTFGLHQVAASDASAHTANLNFNVTSKIILLPASGPVGTKVTVNGTGYASNSAIIIKYDGVIQTIPATAASVIGSFSVTFTVPASTVGLHTVAATDASSHTATAMFNRT